MIDVREAITISFTSPSTAQPMLRVQLVFKSGGVIGRRAVIAPGQAASTVQDELTIGGTGKNVVKCRHCSGASTRRIKMAFGFTQTPEEENLKNEMSIAGSANVIMLSY